MAVPYGSGILNKRARAREPAIVDTPRDNTSTMLTLSTFTISKAAVRTDSLDAERCPAAARRLGIRIVEDEALAVETA